MLSDIVDELVRFFSRPSWIPPTMTVEDLKQEAWAAVLDAEAEGARDRDEIKRVAKLGIERVLHKELDRRELPHPNPHLAGSRNSRRQRLSDAGGLDVE